MIARKNQVVLRVVPREVPFGLSHGIRRALIPAPVIRCLLRCQNLDEPVAEAVEPVGLADVAIERCRVELGQDEDSPDAGVKAVADRDVYKAVLAADRNGGLRPKVCQRKEPGALTAAQDDREDVTHRGSV